MLLLGGTHANEPAGFMAAVVMLETARVKRGRLIIAPFANPMARTHTFPQDAHPQTFGFTTTNGTGRTFRFGARITDGLGHDSFGSNSQSGHSAYEDHK